MINLYVGAPMEGWRLLLRKFWIRPWFVRQSYKNKFLFQDAYIHYLKCVQYIVQILLNDAQRPGSVKGVYPCDGYIDFSLD